MGCLLQMSTSTKKGPTDSRLVRSYRTGKNACSNFITRFRNWNCPPGQRRDFPDWPREEALYLSSIDFCFDGKPAVLNSQSKGIKNGPSVMEGPILFITRRERKIKKPAKSRTCGFNYYLTPHMLPTELSGNNLLILRHFSMCSSANSN